MPEPIPENRLPRMCPNLCSLLRSDPSYGKHDCTGVIVRGFEVTANASPPVATYFQIQEHTVCPVIDLEAERTKSWVVAAKERGLLYRRAQLQSMAQKAGAAASASARRQKLSRNERKRKVRAQVVGNSDKRPLLPSHIPATPPAGPPLGFSAPPPPPPVGKLNYGESPAKPSGSKDRDCDHQPV